MNPEVKTKWIDALLSDEYEQGHGFLTDNGKYCCLGVLCDLAVKEGVIPEPEVYSYQGFTRLRYGVEGDKNMHYLPKAVMAWAELDAFNPELNANYDYRTLGNYNDRGAKFEQVAAAIESSL